MSIHWEFWRMGWLQYLPYHFCASSTITNNYQCYPAAFSLMVLWFGGASRSCGAVHRPPEVWTWSTQGELVYDWLHSGVGPGIDDVTIAGFSDLSWLVSILGCNLLCVYKLIVCAAWHDIFVMSLTGFNLLQVGPAMSSCNCWCSGGCTSLCRTGSASYTG